MGSREEQGWGDAELNILLGRTAATPQTGFRMACTLKYSSGGEGGKAVVWGAGHCGWGQNRSRREAEAARRREQDKVFQMESELRRKLPSEMVQRAEEGEDRREAAEE